MGLFLPCPSLCVCCHRDSPPPARESRDLLFIAARNPLEGLWAPPGAVPPPLLPSRKRKRQLLQSSGFFLAGAGKCHVLPAWPVARAKPRQPEQPQTAPKRSWDSGCPGGASGRGTLCPLLVLRLKGGFATGPFPPFSSWQLPLPPLGVMELSSSSVGRWGQTQPSSSGRTKSKNGIK